MKNSYTVCVTVHRREAFQKQQMQKHGGKSKLIWVKFIKIQFLHTSFENFLNIWLLPSYNKYLRVDFGVSMNPERLNDLRNCMLIVAKTNW